jgi:hypothetical protein
MGRVRVREMCQVRGQILERVDRVRRADRNAGAAIDAVGGVDVQVRGVGEAGFVFLGMDAIHRASLDAQLVLRASICDYICHAVEECNSAATATER